MARFSRLRGRAGRTDRGRAKRAVAWAVYAAIALFFLLMLFLLRSILLPFVIALLLAYVFSPLVARLHRRGLPRWLGAISVYAALVGLATLFLTFLVPVIDSESAKLLAKANLLFQDAPRLYERLEAGVGNMLDRFSGNGEIETESDQASAQTQDADWGFGPPVHKIPALPPPALSYADQLTFGATDEALLEAGLPEQPRVAALQVREGRAELASARRTSALLVEQVKPGTFGVNLGSATIEVRQQGEGLFTVASRDETIAASRFSDVKSQVVSSMRRGLQQFSTALLGGFFTFFQGLVSGLMNALIGLVIVFLVGAFAMIDGPNIVGGVRERLPHQWRSHFDELLGRLDSGLSGVVRGQLLICLVNGVLSTIGFLIFIPEYAVVLGVFAGLLSLVPIFGTIISSIPAILVALSISLGHALGVLSWVLGIHFVEAYLLNPNIIGRQAHIHPIIVVFVLIAGEAFYGMKGILLAVPVASVVQSLVQFGFSRVKGQVL